MFYPTKLFTSTTSSRMVIKASGSKIRFTGSNPSFTIYDLCVLKFSMTQVPQLRNVLISNT